MHELGNEFDARTIYSWVDSHRVDYGRPSCILDDFSYAPEGWEYIGSGSFRSVWRSPEGIAYKVNHHKQYSHQSSVEVRNLGRAWKEGAPNGCRLPRFGEFRVDGETIVAIEYIKGVRLYDYRGDDKDHMYELLEEIEYKLNLQDMHDENALVDDDGLLVPVDLGG